MNILKNLKENKLLFLSLGILFLLTAYIFIVSYRVNQQHSVYSLDDAYIHMTLAKNTVEHGVWGINKSGFSSCSSSPVWTSMLAIIYFLSGANEITPLILNVIFAFLILVSIYFFYKKEKLKTPVIFIFLVLNILLIPIPALIFTGLEHLLHIFSMLVFLYLSSEVISRDKIKNTGIILLAFISFILPVIRYEGLVIVIITTLLFILNRKWLTGIIILISSLILITIFGLYSISRGWSFFPNSLLLRGLLPDVTSFSDILIIIKSLITKYQSPFIYVCAAVCGIIFITGLFLFAKKSKLIQPEIKKKFIMVLLVLANIIVFTLYSHSDYEFRYRSFLIALILFPLPVLFNGITKSETFRKFKTGILYKISFALIAVFVIPVVFIFSVKSLQAMYDTPQMTNNIYEQQYQMAMFINEYYDNSVIGLNDVGAVSYFSGAKVIDLVGLSYLPISKNIRTNNYTADNIRQAVSDNDIKIAILYDSGFITDEGSIIPAEWIRVDNWKIKNNIIAGDDNITFYAVNKTEARNLFVHLKEFSPELPNTVTETLYSWDN